jgi:hypothetical protein
MKKRLIFSFLFIFFIFTGCGVNSPAPTSAVPEWFLNAPSSNSMYYYAVGEGSSKDEAKLRALNQIASEISTTISSKTNINKQSLNINGKKIFNASINQNINAEVKNINFDNAKITKASYSGGKFYVLVRVDRQMLFTKYKNQIDDLFVKLKNLYNLSKTDFISYLRNKDKMSGLINKLLAKIALAKSINPEFNAKYYNDQVNHMLFSLKKMITNTKIAIRTNSKNAISYKTVLEKYLSTLGVKIVPKSDFYIQLNINAKPKKVSVRDPRLIGVKWAEVTLDIKVVYKKQIISSNTITVINGSKDSYKAAVVKTRKFERKLKEIGIVNLLIGM